MNSVPVDRQPGNLPAEMTPFIGRRGELSEARRLLETARLVTLTGVGGVGKTRLALRTARTMRRTFPDGAWFVELSALRAPDLLATTVGEALRVSSQSKRGELDLLVDHLADKRALLVLDTCEHLIDACAMLVEVLLRGAPGLRVLTTSREPFDVPGEHSMVVPPLVVPPDGATSSEGADAMALFADRAAAVVPGFTVTERNREAVAGLCRRLDGIPLAIELAAVRLRVLSVERIVERLDGRFRLLGSSHTSLPRHQTLHATVDWSHDLCTPDERLVWARLSVFAGGFDLEAAEYVCQGEGTSGDAVFDSLTRLVEKSIVLRDERGDESRYRMLDTIREYGAERLRERGEQEIFRRRHRDWFRDLAGIVKRAMVSHEQQAWLVRLHREHANLRTALDYSAGARDDGPITLRMAASLTYFWILSGHFAEGRRWLVRALESETGHASARADAIRCSGILAALQGDLGAAERNLQEARALTDELDAPDADFYVRMLAGLVAFLRSDLDLAIEYLDMPGLADRAKEDVWSLLCMPLLGGAYCLTGRLDEALAVTDTCVEISEAVGERWCRSHAIWMRGVVHSVRGEPEAALGDGRESLRLKRTLDDRHGIAMALDLVASCAGVLGDPVRAAFLFGAADRMWRAFDAPMFGPAYVAIRQAAAGGIRVMSGEHAWNEAHARGERTSLADAIADALAEQRAARGTTSVRDPLTKREREIATLVTDGLSNREIADRLVIAKRTADAHIEHILAKLDFSSRAQIAAWVAAREDR